MMFFSIHQDRKLWVFFLLRPEGEGVLGLIIPRLQGAQDTKKKTASADSFLRGLGFVHFVATKYVDEPFVWNRL